MRLRRLGSNQRALARKLAGTALVNLDAAEIVGSSPVTEWSNADTGYSLTTPVNTAANIRKAVSDAMLGYGANGDYAASPDSAASSITGDIDIRFDGVFADWDNAGSGATICGKIGAVGNRSLWFYCGTSGPVTKLVLRVYYDGTNFFEYTSTVAASFVDGARGRARVTLDVDNGASDSVATFYTASVGGAWEQLGDPVLRGSTISIFDSTAALEIMGIVSGTSNVVSGSAYTLAIYNGIDGTLAVDFNAADYVNRTSDTQFPSSTTGEVWTLNGNTFIQNTSNDVVDTIGSVGLETTAGQDISTFTAFIVARFKTASPAGDQFLFDSRSDAAKSVRVFSDNSNSNKWTFDAGGTPIALSEPYDTDWHVHTIQYNADATTTYTVSGVGTVTGDAGSEALDYMTLAADLSAANSGKLSIGQVVVNPGAYSESQVQAMNDYLLSKFRV